MASVRMTQELRSQISRAADDAYDLANPAPVPSHEFLSHIRKAISKSKTHELLSKWHKEAEEAGILETEVGKADCPKVVMIDSIDLIPTERDDDRRNRLALKFETKFSHATYRYKDTRFSWDTPNFYISSFDPEYKTQAREYYDQYKQALDEHAQARIEYRGSIAQLLESCSTLKQLLEVWPAAESLIPQDKIQKMHEKVTRKERAAQIKEEINFDPTIANQSVLTAKMLGG